MQYYIGIDGGGTGSRLLAVDTDWNVIGNAYGKSTNLTSNSYQQVQENIRHIVRQFCTDHGRLLEDCLGICIGSAGLDTHESQERMKQLIKELGFTRQICAINDSLLALSAMTEGGPGIVVISGTGSIAYGIDDQRTTYRCGGWGHLLDDCGSGYWIGLTALKRAFRAEDGRGSQTALTKRFYRELQIHSMPEVLDQIYQRFDKAEIARYAVIVSDCAQQGDQVSCEILAEAAEELALLTAAIYRKMQLAKPQVIISGGSLLNNQMLYQCYLQRIAAHCPGMQIIPINREPVLGAIYLIRQESSQNNECSESIKHRGTL